MARRKEVFQSKVFQKLYRAAPTLKKEPSPPRIVEDLAKKTYVKRKASSDDTTTAKTQDVANPGRRMYTVLPPPADHEADPEKSVTLPLPEGINTTQDPAEITHDSAEELEEAEEGEQRRRRRRGKRKVQKDAEARPVRSDETPAADDGGGGGGGGGEHVSRNKKRKMKKKRHKEKLLSMGLVPRAAALEFTYRRDGGQEEEEEEEDGGDKEEDKRRAAEVADFLRTTMDIYTADSSLCVDEQRPLLAQGTVDELLGSIAGGQKPASVLKRLCSLKAFVQQKDTDGLERALEELRDTSPMSAEETTAVVSLFQYWIKDILPMQGDEKTEPSTMHPRDCHSQ